MNFKKICLLLLTSGCFSTPMVHAMDIDLPDHVVHQKPKVEALLKELGIELPTPATPVANYVPFKGVGNSVYLSGQLPFIGDKKIIGKVGGNLTLEQGQEAASLCLYNVLAHLKVAAGGSLDNVQQCVSLDVLVNGTSSFINKSKAWDTASNLLAKLFGEDSRHPYVANDVNSLPFGAPVEIKTAFLLNNIPSTKAGRLVKISNQYPFSNERQYIGKLGREFTLEQGQEAAKLGLYNLLTQLKGVAGNDLSRVKQCVFLNVIVNGTDDFTDQPKVANAASDHLVKVFGENGKHARAAYGVNS